MKLTWADVDEVQSIALAQDFMAPLVATVSTHVASTQPTIQVITTSAADIPATAEIQMTALAAAQPAAGEVWLVTSAAVSGTLTLSRTSPSAMNADIPFDAPSWLMRQLLTAAFTDLNGGNLVVSAVAAGGSRRWLVTFPADMGAIGALTGVTSSGAAVTAVLSQPASVQEVQQVR